MYFEIKDMFCNCVICFILQIFLDFEEFYCILIHHLGYYGEKNKFSLSILRFQLQDSAEFSHVTSSDIIKNPLSECRISTLFCSKKMVMFNWMGLWLIGTV